MDALKFAFEILIVGALALPWLAVLIHMFSPGGVPTSPVDTLESFLSVVPRHARDIVGMVVILAVGYLLGSAVSRISRSVFDDELWGGLPTESRIRDQVYHDEYCKENLLGALHLPEFQIKEHPRLPEWLCVQSTQNSPDKPRTNDPRFLGLFHPRKTANAMSFEALVQEMFRLQEGELLLDGEDKVERLKEYYDQIDVLRGAALNGVLLFALCLFGCFGNLRARQGHRIWRLLTFLPAFIVTGYGAYSLWSHWTSRSETRYSNPPLAEVVLLMLGLAGFYLTRKAKAETARFYLRTCAAAAVFTLISYGGWCWTEVMYDLHVIHSIPELPKSPSPTQAARSNPTPWTRRRS